MDRFTARPNGWKIATHAWGSTRDGILAMPLLFLSAMVLGIGLSLVTFLPAVANLAMVAPKSVSAALVWRALEVRTALSLVWALVAAPVAVAMHRFILLGEVARGPVSWLPRHTLAFTAWLLCIRLFYVLIAAPPFLLHDATAEAFALGCVGIAAAIVGVFLAMLFPAVAIDAPSRSISARLETSMEQMSGNFWLFVWTVILVFLPIVAVTMIVQLTVLRPILQAAVAGTAHGTLRVAEMILAGFMGALQIVSVALAASAASWLYGWVSRPSSSDAASG